MEFSLYFKTLKDYYRKPYTVSTQRQTNPSYEMKVPLSVIALLLSVTATAQNFDLGSWNILNIKYTYSEKWSIFAEAQLRSLKFYNDFHYYEYKGGVNYKIEKNIKITLGAGSYQTYKEGGDFVLPKNNNEFRVWPQIVLSQSISKLKIEQRYRAELRFTSSGYRNRFRYRLGVSYPFGKDLDGYKPFQISASNELFFTDNEPYFERNRALVAFNYKPSMTVTLQVGYLHQFDYKINDETGRDFIQIGVFIELYRKATKNSHHDSTSEIELKDN
jgi:long-subunit fatty acid transport protein